MTNEYEDYEVQSYFINVGQGDSAIHILRQRKTLDFQAAVLIDGGRATSDVAVEKTITRIRNDLAHPFAFKSIVVTHWDLDHFAGVMNLLYEQWEAIKQNPPPPVPIVSYISADTTFYCPLKSVDALGSNIEIGPGPTNKHDPLWLRFKLGSDWFPVCRAVVSTWAIGYNLFTGFQHAEEQPEPGLITQRKPPSFTLANSLNDVYAYAPHLTAHKRPIFLIYGVDGCSLSDNGWQIPEVNWKKTDRADKNNSSVVALIIWPVPAPTSSMRVSLYTGGDVEQVPTEDAVIKWMGVGLGSLRRVCLDVVKASHHGSHFSTSEDFFLQDLQYLIISAGRQHGHPSFAVAYCFLALAKLWKNRLNRHPVMVCTRYPYWLAWHPSRLYPKDCNPSTVLSWGESALAILASFALIETPGDNNFLTNYMQDQYGAALTSAKAYALLTRDIRTTSVDQFNAIVLAHNDHPMRQTAYPDLLASESHYLESTIKEIQESFRLNSATYLEPGSDNARGAQWIKLVASGNTSNIVRVLEPINDMVFDEIRIAAQIWTIGDDLAWAMKMPDALAVARAALFRFSQAVVDVYKLPQGTLIAKPLMGPAAVPPGFASVEEWIGSVLMRGLLDARPNLGPDFDVVLADTESVCAKWYGDCFTSSASLRLAGARDQGKVLLKRADIRLKPSTDDSSQRAEDAILSFSTDKAARALQFGSGAETGQTLLGFDDNIQGVLFALDTSYPLTVMQLARLVNVPLSRNALVSGLLGSIELSSYGASRSGIWFIPEFKSRTIMRMAMKPKGGSGINNLRMLMGERLGPVRFSDVVVVGTCVMENLGPEHCESSAKLGLQVDIAWENGDVHLPPFEGKAFISFTASGVELVFKLSHRDNLLETLLDWAQVVMGGQGKPSVPASFEISLEIDVRLSNDSDVPFLATVRWNNGAFQLSAQIWPPTLVGNTSSLRLHPFYEETTLTAPTTANPIYAIPLRKLLRLSDGVNMPPGLPTEVAEAQVMVGFDHGRTRASFSAILECNPAPATSFSAANGAAAPVLSLGRVSLDLGVGFTSEGGSPNVDIRLDACLTLSIPEGFDSIAIPEPAQSSINFRISYEQNSSGYEWVASASIEQLRVAHLCELFARDGSDHAILDLMGGICVVHAGIEHRYNGGTSLDIDGTLRLGPLKPGHAVELGFKYKHLAKDKSWSFTTDLRPKWRKGTIRIADLLSNLVDDTELPGFLRNLEVPIDSLEVNLKCEKTSDDKKNAQVLFSLTIKVGDFDLTLVQLRSVAAAKLSALARANDLSASGTPDDAGPAQMLRFALPTIRRFPHMPVVGAVKQPFDEMGILWTNRDLSAAEVQFFNDNVFSSRPLLSKDKSGVVGPVLRGIHFQVAMREAGKHRLVLDHVVAKKKPKKKRADTGEFIGLSISGQSFSNIIVSLDATLNLGPVSLKLLGLTLTFNLESVTSLDSFPDLVSEIGIRGMAVDFEKSPSRLAGLFTPFGSLNDAEAGFMGAIAVSVATWSAIAAGMYSENSSDHLKSLFVFGAIRGPILTVGSVDVDGLTGGFGYNSRLKLPSVSQVAEFPFVAMNNNASAPPGSLMTHLSTLRRGDGDKGAWVIMVPNDMWLAAGVSLKAFQTVDAQVLIALTLADEPKFAVIAQATAVFPKGQSQDRAFLVLDTVISAEIDLLHSTILVAGELTPRSFILDPSCRLTGGFACQLFLTGSPYEGDFVFTVGGYNNQYSIPSHYPAAPSRVGIYWRYDSDIYISGSAYFAITPQVAMGGGRMDLVVDKGWVRATFSAWADFFMHYHPFSFTVEVGITLWAEVNLPAPIFNIHLGPSEFSARLGLHGPPMAGYVHLHFWKYNTIVAFGPQMPRPAPLSWGQFLRMAKNLPAEPHESDGEKAPNHMVTIVKGAVPVSENARSADEDKDSTEILEIRATHLEFQVQARVPVLAATVGKTPRFETKGSSSLFARPMQKSQAIVDSHMTVTLNHTDTSSESQVELEVQNVVIKKVAPALWGRYNEYTPPSTVASEDMLEHAMALDDCVPPKEPSDERLPALDIVQFNSTDLEPGKIPAVGEAKYESIKLESIETGSRRHAHMLNIKPVPEGKDTRAQLD
ncbi:hypothetical protein B0J13DRAFT_680245 [Dactylonectria estremocensis]|uniref:DUF6603 domain-containing protein n=1 Tax=Dactylonectria estremocensis TaxID=1079267 RepID=A0A9P9DNA6_9HYPO|nr:hypothetical protein B0J13DRAFT_680245 [Dactylonectria estremocensis]